MSETAIAFGTRAAFASGLDDECFLQLVAWRKSADPALAAAASAGDVSRFCQALRTTLDSRRVKRTRPQQSGVLPTLLQPLWSQHAWDDPATSSSLSAILVELQKRLAKHPRKVSRKASRLVRSGLGDVPLGTSPWTQVAWLSVLVGAANLLEDDALLELWRQSLTSIIPQIASAADAGSAAEDFADDRQLLLTGELPWLAGLTFADVAGAGRIRQRGRRELRAQLEATTDGDGTPHARTLHRLPLFLAVMTRSASLADLFDEKLLSRHSVERFSRLIERTAVMAHSDGRLALSNGSSFAPGSLLKSASVLAGVRSSHPSGRRLLQLPNDAPGTNTRQRSSTTRMPKVKHRRTRNGEPPSSQSDWAELACLRNNWSDGGDCCIVAHHGTLPQLSVCAFERHLIDGEWDLSVEVDDVAVELTADWSCVCWFSDEDADYVELEQQVEGKVTLLRQVLLSRTDHWLLLADNARVSCEAAGEATPIRMTSRLPLATSVTAADNRWTRELSLRAEKLKCTAYPLTLAQERVDSADGSLTVEDDHLVLRQSSPRGGLHMPLLLDWSPDRQSAAPVWRLLTVAEDGRRLPAHIACGQRLQIGRHQWLFYRSLQRGETGRTVLGHHTPHETVIAEFTSWGEVEPIVQVE